MARRWNSLVLAIALIAVSGCQRDSIRAYTAPKDDRPSPPAAAPQRGPASTSATPEWDVPAGWQQIPGSGMRFATLIIGEGDDAPQIRVTPLGSIAGESLSNVNRWRTQIGLDPMEESELGSVLTTIDVDGYSTDLIRLVSEDSEEMPAQETLAAILRAEDQVWFFMANGPREAIEPHEEAFRNFVAGIRMERPGGAPTSPAGSADSGGSGSSELAWVLPAGWAEVSGSSSMRLATFRVGQGEDAAEVAITKFPGRVGGLLANVNRWRGQLDLAPVDDLANQVQESVMVAGAPAMLLDLAPEGATAGDSRMLVVLAPRGEFTWFLKMTGTHSILGQEKAGFEAFVQSVELPEGS